MNYVATKTFIIAIKVKRNYKKNVATKKLMLRHNEELKVDISVMTKEDYIVTIKAAE